jgi:hypothetical protein
MMPEKQMTNLCLACDELAIYPSGHVHLSNGKKIFAGWCAEHVHKNSSYQKKKFRKKECQGCYGRYKSKLGMRNTP